MRDGWAGGDGETNPVANNKIKKRGGTGEWRWRSKRRWLNNLYTSCYSFFLFHWRGPPYILPVDQGSLLLFSHLWRIGVVTVTVPLPPPQSHPGMVQDTVSRRHCWQMASIGLNNLLTAPLSFSPVSGVRPLTFPPSAASGSGVLYGIHISKRTLLQPALDMWDLSAKRHRVKVRGQCTAMTCSFF